MPITCVSGCACTIFKKFQYIISACRGIHSLSLFLTIRDSLLEEFDS